MSEHSIDNCMLCHASDFRTIHRRDRWYYKQCLGCGLVSLYPKPTSQELIENYTDYLPTKNEEIAEWESMMKLINSTSADLVESKTGISNGKLLDIGCGYGFFLNEMKNRGWQVEGVEISQTGRQYIKETWQIDVYSEPLERCNIRENSYDVVTLFYVIEHVHDPLSLLKAVHAVLKPGGRIMLRWPHTTPIVRILGPLSKHLDLYHAPYHLYDFSPRTITKLLHLSNFYGIKTMIGGYTLSSGRLARWSSISFGNLAETLYRISGGKILLPGVSKTTLARKAL
ncbi:MAG: class I SAM-dependent methyltransferase [Deltaproteobacteria bacterium]|nr:class I SAM-dependent methyltransferase [Deltaproteobacteria bacterium]